MTVTVIGTDIDAVRADGSLDANRDLSERRLGIHSFKPSRVFIAH